MKNKFINFCKIEDIINNYSKKINLSLKISDKEFFDRNQKVQSVLNQRKIDIGIFFWYREMPGDGIYLTGYNPNIEKASGLVLQKGFPIILAGPEAGKLAIETTKGRNVKVYFVKEFSIPDEYYEGINYHSLREIIQENIDGPIKRVGFLTNLDIIPSSLVDIFRESFDKEVEFVDASDILKELRYEKSKSEFDCMAQANKISSAAAQAMLSTLKPGLRESQVAAVGDFVMKSLGAEGYGFETIVNSGPRCRTIIGPASNKIMSEGEIVQIGCSASYEGYKGVLRRTVILGKPTIRQSEFMKILSGAYLQAEEALKEVVSKNLNANRIDLAARNYFSKYEIDGLNMKEFHAYSSAHGTGLTECLEPMVVGPDTFEKYGKRVGIMLDVGCYGHPNDEIAGGCIENAFGKNDDKLLSWSTDVPIII